MRITNSLAILVNRRVKNKAAPAVHPHFLSTILPIVPVTYLCHLGTEVLGSTAGGDCHSSTYGPQNCASFPRDLRVCSHALSRAIWRFFPTKNLISIVVWEERNNRVASIVTWVSVTSEHFHSWMTYRWRQELYSQIYRPLLTPADASQPLIYRLLLRLVFNARLFHISSSSESTPWIILQTDIDA